MSGSIPSGYIPPDLTHDQGLVVLIMGTAIAVGVVIHMFRRRK
ncbi:hypothetical protein OG785_17895 [Streptomyces sp. NBC_00006]|nr:MULTISPECIES: hypothetical protein [unclassified Streptomyces]MCX5532426.1 hypothetical protein [Streptomyces sp. NBC_00006]